MGGNAAPGGEWQYGRLKVLIDGFWSPINKPSRFGLSEVQVVCRQLGFASGARLLTGSGSSVLPAGSEAPTAIQTVFCRGNEVTLADCNVRTQNELLESSDQINRFNVMNQDAAVLCTTFSGVSILSDTTA